MKKPINKKEIFTIIISVLVIIVAIFFFTVHHYVKQMFQPVNPNSEQVVQMQVPSGASDLEISNMLQDNHLVQNGHAFNYYLKLHDVKTLKSGYYKLSPSMTNHRIMKLIEHGGANHPFYKIKYTKHQINVKRHHNHKTYYKRKIIIKKIKSISPKLV